MSAKKKYLIELFLKCSQHLFSAEANLKAHEDLLKSIYTSIDDDEFSKVISENGIKEYLEKITLVIDSMFSQEEIESLIEFFRSPLGRKLVDKKYLLKIPYVISDITSERERRLSKMDRE